MSSSTRCVILGLAALVALAPARGWAAGGNQPNPGASAVGSAMGGDHPAAPCALHGGVVTKTVGHYFETVFGLRETKIYAYDTDQHPVHLDGGRGIGNVTFKDGKSKVVGLNLGGPKKGEPLVYFCSMDKDVIQSTPGTCPKCQMPLTLQNCLVAQTDFSAATPDSIRFSFRLFDLPGKESTLFYDVVFVPTPEFIKAAKAEKAKAAAGKQEKTVRVPGM